MNRVATVWVALVALARSTLAVFRSPVPTPPSAQARHRVKVERVEDLPYEAKPAVLYVAGEGENTWAAAIVCPCGCRDLIQLNLLPGVRPRWKVYEHEDGSASLLPSAWRKKGCNSHFILRRGEIIWCQPGQPPSFELDIDHSTRD